MKVLILILSLFLVGCVVQKDITQPTIPLYEYNDMHFIKIILNGKKTMLLLDTGASKSLLDISKADEYNFSHVLFNKKQYIGLGGKKDISIVFDYKVDDMFISFLGTDLEEVTGYFEEEGIEIVGVLGSDYLEKHNVIVDFDKNILFYKP